MFQKVRRRYMQKKLLDAAIEYLNLGFSVIPVGKDKKPLIQWKEFQNRKPTRENLENWFGNKFATGIAIVTGKISGLVVLDAESGADFTGLKIPETPTVNTGGGGVHYYFKLPENSVVQNSVKFRPLMDIRGEGGCVVAPPSLHPSGKYYEWVIDFASVKLANMPGWLIKELEQKKPEATEKNWPEVLQGVDAGKRNETAASVSGKFLAHLPKGEWENMAWPALRGWNLQNNPPLSESELRSVFNSIKQRQLNNKQEKQSKKSEAATICLADIKAEPVNWLWQDRIALGKITLIAGDPGLGKSLITSMLASVVSKGYGWPLDNSTSPIGDVILLSAEDDPADTIRPRLDAARADCNHIHIIEAIKEISADGSATPRIFSFKKDIAALDQCLFSFPNCKLVVIDPVSAYLDGTDGNSNSDIRGLFAPLVQLAGKYKVAVVLIQHLNKGGGTNALYRPMGSLAFIATARASFIVVKDPDNPQRRLFMPAKNNLAKENNGLAYFIVEAENGAPVIAWEPNPITITADEALAIPKPNEERTATDEAADFLRNLLSAGPMQVSEIEKEARQAGINNKPLRSARNRLGIKPVKSSFQGGWVWALPQDALNSQEAHSLNEGNLELQGQLGENKQQEIKY